VHWIGSPEPPAPKLLCPAWLLVGSRLEVRGRGQVAGRDAWEVTVTKRPGTAVAVTGALAGRTAAAVDAELGIVLRLAEDADGSEPAVTEVVSLELGPVTGPQDFAPPPGSRISETLGEMQGGAGLAWRAVKTAGGLAAGGLGAWIRHSAARAAPSQAAGEMGEMPPCDPAPDLSAGRVPAGPQVSDEVLSKLHQGGAGHFEATMHQWMDVAAAASRVPAGARSAGLGGIGRLADAVSELPATAHLVSAVRVGGPGQYQVDSSRWQRTGPGIIACDGQRCWQVREGTATVGPAESMPGDIGSLADPSWLLECRLSGGEPVTVGGRPACRLSVARRGPGWASPPPQLLFPAAVAVVDAELGIVLSLTSYIGSTPVQRYELRDITTAAGDFQVDIPPDLPVTEASDRREPPPPSSLPLVIAAEIGRQAAKEAGKVAGNLRDRLQQRSEDDGRTRPGA
jgi:hypothetical protein